MNCEYGIWLTKSKTRKDGRVEGVLYPAPCGRLGTAQQVIAQSGDTFKFRSDGRKAPVIAVLCSEHTTKLREQGCEVELLAKGVGA